MELRSSRDLLDWLVDVWESGPPRSDKLTRGELLMELAVTEGKIAEGPIGLMDGIGYWMRDLRAAGWISYDDTDAAKTRTPYDDRRSRNDVILSRDFLITSTGATYVKSALTAASIGRVADDLAGFVKQVERGIEEAEVPEQTKQESLRLLHKVGETAASTTAVELLIRVVFAVVGGHH